MTNTPSISPADLWRKIADGHALIMSRADEDPALGLAEDIHLEHLLEPRKEWGIVDLSAITRSSHTTRKILARELAGIRTDLGGDERKYITFSFDQDFDQAVELCAAGDKIVRRESLVISRPLAAAFSQLHKLGSAHCVGISIDGKLVNAAFAVACGNSVYSQSSFQCEFEVNNLRRLTNFMMLSYAQALGYKNYITQNKIFALQRGGIVTDDLKALACVTSRKLSEPSGSVTRSTFAGVEDLMNRTIVNQGLFSFGNHINPNPDFLAEILAPVPLPIPVASALVVPAQKPEASNDTKGGDEPYRN